jgi:hypothetical protein
MYRNAQGLTQSRVLLSSAHIKGHFSSGKLARAIKPLARLLRLDCWVAVMDEQEIQSEASLAYAPL